VYVSGGWGGYRNEKPFFLRTFINLMLDFIVAMWNRGASYICDMFVIGYVFSKCSRRACSDS
jgi:hypothetical protein